LLLLYAQISLLARLPALGGLQHEQHGHRGEVSTQGELWPLIMRLSFLNMVVELRSIHKCFTVLVVRQQQQQQQHCGIALGMLLKAAFMRLYAKTASLLLSSQNLHMGGPLRAS